MLLAEHRASLDPGRHGQVATDFRLYVLSEGAILRDILKQLIAAVVARAEAEIDVIMPGFTHLQARSAALRATLAPPRRTDAQCDGVRCAAACTACALVAFPAGACLVVAP